MSASFGALSTQLKLAIVGLSCLFFFSLFELGGYLFTTNDWILKSTSELSSMRWYLLWLNQIKNQEIQQVTRYSIDEHHPDLGWVPKKNSRTVMYDETVVSFNSQGIRGSSEYSLEKPPAWQRIAVVGDSFTFGEEVNDAETYSAHLEKQLFQTEVMNFGVHGYGIDQMLLRFEQEVIPYKPDIVIFAFVFDDIFRGFLGFRDYQKPLLQLTDDQQLQLTNTPIPTTTELAHRSQFQLRSWLALQLLSERWKFRDYSSVPTKAFFDAVLTRVYTQAIAHNIQPIFLWLPVSHEMTATDTVMEPEKLLFEFCKNTKAVCLSARPYLLDALQVGAWYDVDRHYNSSTNLIIATGLHKDLIKHQLLPNAQQTVFPAQ